MEGLIDLCTKKIENLEIRSKTIDLIIKAEKMVLSLDMLGLKGKDDTISLVGFAKRLAKLIGDGEVRQIDGRVESSSRDAVRGKVKEMETCSAMQGLPRTIVSAVKVLRSTSNDFLA